MRGEHPRETMSPEQDTVAAEPINETPIPSILTNSAAEVMRAFNDSIIEIEAEASIDNWNKDELRRDYGLMRQQLTRQKITLDYHEVRDNDGEPENPLTSEQVDDILQELNRRLDNFDRESAADMAVSKMVLRVNVPEITEVTRSTTDEYELTFVSDPAGEARGPTERRNYDKGLYDELGFKYRNLNLRSVVETRAKYTEQADGKLMGWGGPEDVRPRCDTKLAQAIYQEVLPKEYRALKLYRIGEANRTVLQSIETNGSEI